MNNQQVNHPVRRNTKVKKDLSTLVGDGAVQFNRFEDNVSQAGQDLTTWVGEGVSDLSAGIEKLTDDTKEAVVEAAATVKKDVRRGLRQYNAKAQEAANKVPGGFGKKAARYPWVAISIALVVGFVLGNLLSPARQTFELFEI